MAPVSQTAFAQRRDAFRALHESGCFVLPNPWDAGSARYLERLGFKALATTSSGFAWRMAMADNEVALDEVLQHLKEIVAATSLPVNADFEDGFADSAEDLQQNVVKAVQTGVAGLSLEDSTGHAEQPLRDIASATDRIRAARAAIDSTGENVLLVGRAENFIVGVPDLQDTINRLQAYAQAGADVLYAPGLKSPDDIRAVVRAVAPKPFNLLIGSTSELSVQQVQELGVRRISVGGALARAAWGGFMKAAGMLAEQGRFDGFEGAASGNELNALFATRQAARRR